MLKPNSLKQALYKALPVLAENPDMMRIFIDEGVIAATLAPSLSFENRYTLNVLILDYRGDINLVLVPLAAWLRENQPDIFTTGDGKGFTYISDINTGDSQDLSISLKLTERTLVQQEGARLYVRNVGEPPEPEPVERPKELYINGELVSQWHE